MGRITNIHIILFANLREALGCAALEFTLPNAKIRVIDLILLLAAAKGTAWRTALTDEKVLIAVNQMLVARDHCLEPGDEVAFLPPVTGG